MASDSLKIFISYTGADLAWAEWIAWQLREDGHEVILQAWHFGAGSNFVHKMQQASRESDRTVAVLSPAYERSDFASSEWAAAFADDAVGAARKLVPVRIEPYQPTGLLKALVTIDLVDLDAEDARARLLEKIRGPREPDTEPPFPKPKASPKSAVPPKSTVPPESTVPPRRFPGTLPPFWNVPHRRNPFFTGREKALGILHDALRGGGQAALAQIRAQSLSGLGGLGKTQTAVEYCYRYRDAYQAVLWTRAASVTELMTGFATIAGVLDLPEKDAEEQPGRLTRCGAGSRVMSAGCWCSTMPTSRRG